MMVKKPERQRPGVQIPDHQFLLVASLSLHYLICRVGIKIAFTKRRQKDSPEYTSYQLGLRLFCDDETEVKQEVSPSPEGVDYITSYGQVQASMRKQS